MSLLTYKVNLTATKRYIQTVTAKELASLSTPCYYPKTKRPYFELLNKLKLSNNEFKKFVSETYKGTKAEKWVLWKDVGTNLLIYCMYLFLKERDIKSYFTTMVYYMIIQYARLMNKQIKYCYPETFEVTLSSLSRLHLFIREKGIANALYFLAKEADKRFRDSIKNWDVEQIILFIGISRHRISQSVKSFAEAYYLNRQSNVAIKAQTEPSDSQALLIDNRSKDKVISDIAQKLTVYKAIDNQAVHIASSSCHLNFSEANKIINELANVKYQNLVHTVLSRIVKIISDTRDLCNKKIFIQKARSLIRKDKNLQTYADTYVKQLAKKSKIIVSDYSILYCFIVVCICLHFQKSVCKEIS